MDGNVLLDGSVEPSSVISRVDEAYSVASDISCSSAPRSHCDDVHLIAGHKRGVVLVVDGYMFAKDKNVKNKRLVITSYF
jgi:hypothetical protein